MRKTLIGLSLALAGTLGAAAYAQEEEGPFGMQVEARQGIMAYRALQLGTLGGMAKGDVPYDAAAAQKAADNLLAAATLDVSMLWPEGSDNASHPGTAALPALWTDPAVGESAQALVTAATAMQAAAGTDLAALQAAMGPVGEACTACHKVGRASE